VSHLHNDVRSSLICINIPYSVPAPSPMSYRLCMSHIAQTFFLCTCFFSCCFRALHRAFHSRSNLVLYSQGTNVQPLTLPTLVFEFRLRLIHHSSSTMNRDLSTVFMPDLPFLHESHTIAQRVANPQSTSSTPKLTSTLRTIVLYALTYIITMIAAAYFVIQAMQAISFVLASRHGIVLRLVWLAFTCVAGTLWAVCVREWVAGDDED
jgi:hypothetical protein